MTEFNLPWDDLPPPVRRGPKPVEAKVEAHQRSLTTKQKAAAKQARQDRPDARGEADTGIGWQWWHLVVHGPAEEVTSFAAAARGPGFIPWRHDESGFEENVVAFVFGGTERPDLSVADCRIMSRQFREAIETRRARNERSPGRSTQCPLDLQVLLPVPAALLHLGASHPDVNAWLRRHWGVLDQPRHAEVLEGRTAGRRLPRGHVSRVYGFFTEGPAPDEAKLALQERWPTLVFRLDPRLMT